MKIAIRYARHAGIAALFVAAALLGTLSGVLFAYSDDLPEVSALDNYSPNTITRVLGKDGQLVGEFAVERRVVIHYNDISPNLRQAILAAEDGDFFDHAGFSISRMVLALMRDIASRGRVAGRQHDHPAAGAQPVRRPTSASRSATAAGSARSRNRWSRCRSRSATRRKRSSRSTATRSTSATAPTAWRRRRSCISASRRRTSTLEEAATHRRHHPGQRPAEPVRESGGHPAPPQLRARPHGRRRASSPREVADADQAEADRGRAAIRPAKAASAPYFLEEVRKYLEAKYGAKALYESGLTVRTGARRPSCSRPPTRRSIAACAASTSAAASASRAATSSPKATPSTASRHDRWARRMAAGDIVPAVVRERRATRTAQLRIGDATRPS